MLNFVRGAALLLACAGLTVQATPVKPRGVKPGVKAEVKPTAATKPVQGAIDTARTDLKSLKASARPKPAVSALDAEGARKINGFTQKLLGEILSTAESGKNVFITGPAMLSATTMLVNGATDQGRAELLSALGYNAREMELLNTHASALIKAFNNKTEGVESKMANAFFADRDFAVRSTYKALVESTLNAVATNVPFASQPAVAAETVNKWASESTDGMIQKIVTEDAAAELAALLASAVYIKGVWETQFKPKKTRTEGFFLPDGREIPVNMMNETMDVDAFFSEDNSYLIARLPYTGRTASMYIVYPRYDWNGKAKVTPQQALMLAMENGDLDRFRSGEGIAKTQAEDVSLPKFAIKYSNSELKRIYEAMGVKAVFQGGSLLALSPDSRAYVSYIRMDTALEVDEKGARAAGAASIGVGLESAPMQMFQFNRPFGVVIRDDITGVDMFSGVINDPTEK